MKIAGAQKVTLSNVKVTRNGVPGYFPERNEYSLNEK